MTYLISFSFKNIFLLSGLACFIAASQLSAQEDLFEKPLFQEEQLQSKPLSLREAILRNLLQQPAIRVALYNIDIQKGVAQSSAAPFDPVVNAQGFYTYTKDILDLSQNLNVLNLGQTTMNPLNTAPVNLTESQLDAQCSCPSDSSCRHNHHGSSGFGSCPPAVHTHFYGQETIAHLDVSKKMREGTRLLFSVDIDQYRNKTFCPKKLNVGRTTFEIEQPILRDNKNGLEYMTELANKQQVNATKYETFQTISKQVLDTITLYWDALVEKRSVQVQLESEKRITEILESVKFLIEKEQLAPADLLQPLAQLSAQIVTRVQSEQSYYEAKQQLKFAMGEWNENDPCATNEFDIIDDFPTTQLDPTSFPSIFCRLFPAVYSQRFDIVASNMREGVYSLLLKGAKNLELPQLDVVGRASYTDFTTCSKSGDFFSSIGFDRAQKDFTVGIVFSTPLYRDEAKGLIRQRQSEWAQATAQTQELKQQALADINSALKDVFHLQLEIKKAKEAVDEYQQLMINEKQKLLAGYGSIFVLLNFEASWTSSLLSYTTIQGQIAKNIGKVRYLTGSLIRPSAAAGASQFSIEDVASLPFEAVKK